MARLPRLYVPGLPQLVTQRGNNRNILFTDDSDRNQFMAWLREAVRESELQLHAWVLMPDHVHLLLSSPTETGLGSLMQRLGRRYVRWFNDRHERTGTLWEGRYRSTVVEPSQYLLACYRYIEMNPVRAGLVSDPAFWGWSSCRAHLGLESDPFLTDHAAFWALGNTPFERQAAYRRLLEVGGSSRELEAIRYAAHRGWVLGDLPEALTDAATRRTSPLPKGRPAGRKRSTSQA
jgi:putative transposase